MILYTAFVILGIMVPIKGVTVPVYTQERSTDTALYATGLPELSEFTVCMWYYGLPDDDDRTDDWWISISTSGSTNEMLIGFHESQRFQLWIRSQVTKLTAESSEANDDKLLGWRQHCFTWKADGQFRWYASKLNNTNELELWKAMDVGSATVSSGNSGGNLVLFHDQDSLVGGFQAAQTTTGRLALFNMWDYELTSEQIQEIDCNTTGNLLSMADMMIMGPASLTEETILCREAFNHQGYMDKVSYPHLQSMTMCRVPGAHLSNHVITSSSLDTVKQCISGCVNHPRCLSLNYIIYTRLCELNDAVFSDWMTYKIAQTDYDEGLDPEEYIHYTSQVEC